MWQKLTARMIGNTVALAEMRPAVGERFDIGNFLQAAGEEPNARIGAPPTASRTP
jgi:hypothetical protein